MKSSLEPISQTAKYMFENENNSNDQTYIIIKGKLTGKTEELYYKIQLLDTNKKAYPVMRNYHYKIVIKSFSESANGSTEFADAKTSEPSNNIYAEIFKESPSISDNNNNMLTVNILRFLFTQAGTLKVSVCLLDHRSRNQSIKLPYQS